MILLYVIAKISAIVIFLIFMFFFFINRSYTITDDSIYVKHGIFQKRLKLENYINCYVSSRKFITLNNLSSKDFVINLENTDKAHCEQFLDVIRKHNINILDIDTKKYEYTNYKSSNIYNFTLCQKHPVLFLILGGFFSLFISITLFILSINAADNMLYKLLLLVLCTAFVLNIPNIIFSQLMKIHINGSEITISCFPSKTRTIDVSDITSMHKKQVAYHYRSGNEYVEELQLKVASKLLYTRASISPELINYELFTSYLRDNGVPYSKDAITAEYDCTFHSLRNGIITFAILLLATYYTPLENLILYIQLLVQ